MEDTKRIHPDWFSEELKALDYYYSWMPTADKKPSQVSKNLEDRKRARQIASYCSLNNPRFNPSVYEDTKKIHPDWFKLVGLDYYYSWMPTAERKPILNSKNPKEKKRAEQLKKYCNPNNKEFNQQAYEDTKKIHPDWFKKSPKKN
jgi:hypothetical protein